jgi:hypothetical protein
MDTRIPSSTKRPAPPALGVEARRLASYGHVQPQRGEGSASRLPARTPATAATRNGRPPETATPPRVGTPSQRPVSAATTSSYNRYSVSSYQSTTPRANHLTAGGGASHNRPTSTVSQPGHGDSSRLVWNPRHDRLAALQSHARGHDYAAAGVVRSYHRVPSSPRNEDAASTQSPLPSSTESNDASTSFRWGDSTGVPRRATQVVAPSIRSQAGRLTAASTTTRREDSVVPISRYNRTTRPRMHSTPSVPSFDVASEDQPRTYLDMHRQFERTPTYRPQAPLVEWGSNLSPDSPGYTLQEIRQRRSMLSVGFPQPQNAVAEQRDFAGRFVDAPGRITASSGNIGRQVTREALKVKPEVEAVEEEHKTPGRWRKISGLFKLGRKGKNTSPDQVSPNTTPPTSHSTTSLVENLPKSAPKPSTRPATPFATQGVRRRSPPPPLPMAPSHRPRPAAQVRFATSDIRHPPVSPLSEVDARQGTEDLSPVSPLSEGSPPSNPPRPKYNLRAPPPVPGSVQAEEELLACLAAASALPRRHRGQASASRRRPTEEDVEDSCGKYVKEGLTLEKLDKDQDLFPSPLVVQKRWQRSSPPLSPTERPRFGQHPPEELVGGNAHWGDAQEVRVVHKGKGRLVNSRQNSKSQPPPERSRPVLLEAPEPAPKAGVSADERDGKERRDTTFAGAEVEGRGKGKGKEKVEERDEDGEDDDTRSNAPSWRTNDSRKFSHRVAEAIGERKPSDEARQTERSQAYRKCYAHAE